MTTLVGRLRGAQEALDMLARRHQVPGAALAIAKDDELLDFATGVLSVDTGVETTTDSIFQIGSNTKLFTATLVMQLVDAGKVDLDAPVEKYLNGFALNDAMAASEITVRQLLTHTSGIQGDYFKGFGRGEDAIARYVESLKDIDLVHRPGQMWSYCNAGFAVAGRVAEVVGGAPYHRLLKEKICQPLGLTHTTIQVEEMVARRCAVGHVPGPGGRPMVPPVVVMEYAQAPAGSLTTSTAAELVRFVQMHLNQGAAPDGTSVLSAQSAQVMQEAQVARPNVSSAPERMGLGWLLEEWDGTGVIGHGGGTIGQLSFLQCVPEAGVVIALLTNSGGGGSLWRDLGRWLFEEIAGVQMPGPLKAAATPPKLDLSRYAGTYERLGVRKTLSVEDGKLMMRSETTDEFPEELRQLDQLPPPVWLRPIDQERFVAGVEGVVAFLDFEDGAPNYVFDGRVARRSSSSTRPRTSRRPAKASGSKKAAPARGAAKQRASVAKKSARTGGAGTAP